MRPIAWGMILFCIGAVGWVVSVVLVAITLGSFRILANIFGFLFVASLPVAAIGELVRWLKKKEHGTKKVR